MTLKRSAHQISANSTDSAYISVTGADFQCVYFPQCIQTLSVSTSRNWHTGVDSALGTNHLCKVPHLVEVRMQPGWSNKNLIVHLITAYNCKATTHNLVKSARPEIKLDYEP